MALGRARDYLNAVSQRFSDFEELLLIGARGSEVATDTGATNALGLPRDWTDRARANETVIGQPYWDEALDTGIVVIAEPIRAADDTFLGTLAAKVNFGKMEEILASQAADPSHELYVTTKTGQVLAGSGDRATMKWKLGAATARRLFAREMVPLQYRDFRGVEVVGALRELGELGWGVVAHKDRAAAYSAITELRNFTLALIAAVSLGIGVAAYLLCLTIVPPLKRLAGGATDVAGGDLDVSLPVHGHSEVSHMTEVFNGMVARLRSFRDENVLINQKLRDRNVELHELSITDGLTGVFNRTYLPQMLDRELARSQRHNHRFSILMIDIDHFKRFNDTHGHQAGDEVLSRVAEILRASVRAADYVARYGGEEFLILLTETGPGGAMHFAEKLRLQVEQMDPVSGTRVTISIGVGSFPDNGESVESIIRDADEALYTGKREGRNRVVLAPRRSTTPESASG
jgi:diguanylate cyclase (GGDEF)-like protein